MNSQPLNSTIPPQPTKPPRRRLWLSQMASLLALLLFLAFSAAAQAQFTTGTSNGKITITGYAGSGGAVIIPSTINGLPVTSIGDSAFWNCAGLTSITIPGSVTSIGVCAFNGCTRLEYAIFVGNAPSMGWGGFNSTDRGFAVYYCNTASGFSSPTWNGYTALVVNPATNLSALAITGGTLSPVFSPVVTNYVATVPNSVTSVMVTRTPVDPTATVQVTGGTGLVVGNNTISVKVTAPNGTTFKTYTIIVTRKSEFVTAISDGKITITRYTGNGGAVVIPSTIDGLPVTSIGESAFDGCTGLTSVTIPSGVTYIGTYAFKNCTGLTSVTIPGSVTSIGGEAFYSCTGLVSIKVDATNANYYSGLDGILFNKYQTTLLQYPAGKPSSTYTIPSGVTRIGDWAFEDCTHLTSVTIPGSITSIGWGAFNSCTGLTSVTIPGSVTRIEWGAFSACTSLVSIKVDAINANYYSSVDGILFNDNRTTLLQYPAGKPSSTYTIPSGVTSIGDLAFEGCTRLTSVTIPGSVTTIYDDAFNGCTNLKYAIFMGNAPDMGDGVFGFTASGFAVYYYNTASGFSSPTWYGYKAVVVNPANANLSSLAITGGTLSPVFAPTVTNYAATVPNSVTSVTVTRTPADPSATVQVTGGTGLIVGNNTITVKVTASNRTTTKTYTIVVKRLPNVDLSALALSSGTLSPVFIRTGTSYVAQVSASTIRISPTLVNPAAHVQVRINGSAYAAVASGSASAVLALNAGANLLEAKVTAEDGVTVKTYQVIVFSQRPEADTVAFRGDAAPGISRATFAGFTEFAINDYGHVAFRATLAGSGATTANNVGIWAERGTVSKLVARAGTAAVGVTGGTFATLGDPIYNNRDQTAFIGTLAVSGSVTTANSTGIWCTGTTGVLALVTRAQTPVAGRPTFSLFRRVAMPSQGGVMFLADVAAGTGVTSANNQGVWAINSRNVLQQVVRKGQTVQVGTVAKVITGFSTLTPPTNPGAQARSFNGSGALICTATFGDGTQGFLSVSPALAVSVLAVQNGAAPGISGAKFASFVNPAINDRNHAAFRAVISGTGITTLNNTGIWADRGTVRGLVARTGALAGNIFASLSEPVYDNLDRVTFLGTLKSGVAGVSALNDEGIWATGTTGVLAPVVREQAQAPGCPTGAKFASFPQFVLPDRGGVVFQGTLTAGTGGVTTVNAQGVWAVNTLGQPKLIVRTGDTLVVNNTVRTISSLYLFGPSVQSSNFNRFGTLIYKATFTDGTQGLFAFLLE